MRGQRKVTEKMFDVLRSWGLATRYASAHVAPTKRIKVLGPKAGGGEILIGHLEIDQGEYVFRYSDEYKASGGAVLSSFPDKHEEYRSRVLWPFFAVRIPPSAREDYKALLASQRIDPKDTFAVLGRVGARTAASPYRLEVAA